MKKSKQEFAKTDIGKTRLDLIPAEAIYAIGRAMTFGVDVKGYTPHNWALCQDPSRYVAAALRHLVSWNGGELLDPESGLSHLDHASACLAMLVGITERAAKS